MNKNNNSSPPYKTSKEEQEKKSEQTKSQSIIFREAYTTNQKLKDRLKEKAQDILDTFRKPRKKL